MNESNEAHVHLAADDAAQAAKDVELNQRIANARARRREAEAKREAALTGGALLECAEKEEREASDEEAIQRAEEEHSAKRIYVVRTENLGCVIVKRPDPVRYKRFRDQESSKTQDLEKLVGPCIVYPDRMTFDRILDEAPATLDRVADAVVTLAGFRKKELAEK